MIFGSSCLILFDNSITDLDTWGMTIRATRVITRINKKMVIKKEIMEIFLSIVFFCKVAILFSIAFIGTDRMKAKIKPIKIGNNSVKRDNKMLNTVLMFKAITNNTMIMTIKIIFCLKFLSIQYNYMTDRWN